MEQISWNFIFGAFFGAALSASVRYIFVIIDDTSKRFDEICECLNDSAEVGAAYWLKGARDEALREMEAKIHGYQVRLNRLMNLISESDLVMQDNIKKQLDDYLDVLTGGDFEVSFRPEDHGRAIDVQVLASNLIVTIRTHRKRRFFPL